MQICLIRSFVYIKDANKIWLFPKIIKTNSLTDAHTLLCTYILDGNEFSHSGVMRLAVDWAELIIHQALNGQLSWKIMFDGKLIRNFSITVKRMGACWWGCAHTGTGKHSSILIFFLLHTHKHTHTSASLLQRLTFPSHSSTLLCSVLFCMDQDSCLGYNQLNWRWRTLNPSLYVLLYPWLYSQ